MGGMIRLGAKTNLYLLVFMCVAFATGWLAFSYATSQARWSLVVHAVTGLGLLVLVPWKSLIVRRGMGRPRPRRWLSIVFGVLIVVSLAAGIAHSTGLLTMAGPLTAMDFHVGAAIAAVPVAVWHVGARRVRIRRVDVSRRDFLKAGLALGSAATAYAGTELIVRMTGLPGGTRRFTGSYEAGSFVPQNMPVSSWMFDSIPEVDVAEWKLRVGGRELGYEELVQFDDRVVATLDCTGGFYSTQEWAGVRLDRLLGDVTGSSIRVTSHTGYDRRFPREEAGRLLLALRFGGRPLDAAHGYPVRIVAPSRRGFWWVKWVAAVDVDDVPYWWQSPFPMQ